MTYNESAVFTPSGIDACAYWRMWIPHLNINNSHFLFTAGTPPFNEISECDVVVVQRMFMAQNIPFLKMARTYGMRIVYDLDDNIWQLPKSNPAYNIFSSASTQKGFAACAEWADIITVSTDTLNSVVYDKLGHLRNIASKKEIPIITIDNAIDLRLFPESALPKDEDKIVIGWGGSNTHLGDIADVWSFLPDLLEEFPNVYMEFVGHNAPKSIREHPRVTERVWCHISEFAARYATWNWDIVLAPLEQHKFNRSKSCIKMQEAAAISSPCLAEDIAPYKHFVSKTPELQWLLCDRFSWKKKLRELIINKSLRIELGEAMYKNLFEHFNVTRTSCEWREVIQNAARS